MSKQLDEIRKRHKRSAKSIESFDPKFPCFGDGPERQYHADVGYLLGLLQSHAASAPPDSDRQVVVKNCQAKRLGAYHSGHWHVFTLHGVEHPESWEIKGWQELPPSWRDQK